MVEGNHYFPVRDVDHDVLRPSSRTTYCGWKGRASYYSLEVGGQVNEDAAWFYPDPIAGAEAVAGRVAFWHGVEIRD